MIEPIVVTSPLVVIAAVWTCVTWGFGIGWYLGRKDLRNESQRGSNE